MPGATVGISFEHAERISNANPQQDEYVWATAELVEWRSVDGETLQGLLYKPENFDPAQKYPMMVYFYERNADNLHAHYPPIPHRSVRPSSRPFAEAGKVSIWGLQDEKASTTAAAQSICFLIMSFLKYG